ncbi:hypothetical protein [Succinimonas sp.]|uniref:hypothetical protein n=1 Tax=Succinimonas sp. TaxID=1936151 RepID=UPI00386570F6
MTALNLAKKRQSDQKAKAQSFEQVFGLPWFYSTRSVFTSCAVCGFLGRMQLLTLNSRKQPETLT